MNSLSLNNKTYKRTDEFSTNLSDSFVVPKNKTGSGNGEARLYISSQNTTPLLSFSSTEQITKKGKSYPKCTSSCYLSSDNLSEYHTALFQYYKNPTQSHNRNIQLFYNDRLNSINELPSLIEFEVYMQNGNADSQRFYIGSADFAWNLLRELAIPIISTIHISKYVNIHDATDIIYLFTLHSEYNNPTPLSNELISDLSKVEDLTLTSDEITEINEELGTITNNTTIDTTEKLALVKSRKGQGRFRNNTLSIMSACPFTGLYDNFLITASHIKPWTKSSNDERLDGYNGLALSKTYDALFDKGYISFTNAGSLLVSSELNAYTRSVLNLVENTCYNIQNHEGKRNDYLEYHRTHIFKR